MFRVQLYLEDTSMSITANIRNRVCEERSRRDWSQAELARRAGLSRAEVSAIETGRIVPSTAVALAVAGAMGCTVEELFSLADTAHAEPPWAWEPLHPATRFWVAEVGGKLLRFPVEPSASGYIAHDGVAGMSTPVNYQFIAQKTLIIASCDPTAGLLAAEMNRRHGLRVIVLSRGSRAGLELLRRGLIHASGVHLADDEHPDGNVKAVTEMMGPGHRLLSVARWEEGIALSPRLGMRTVSSLFKKSVRWIGREPGSGARQCLDMLFAGRVAPKAIAHNHSEVAMAIRGGSADAGICVRVTSDEHGLYFLSVKLDHYDLCISEANEPRLEALVDAVRSPTYRQMLNEIPGFSAASGETIAAV